MSVNGYDRDCPCDLLPPAKTTVHDIWLLAESVHMILLHVGTRCRKHNHTDSLGRMLILVDDSF